MRILLASDAWYPQINGVVRTLNRVREELEAQGHVFEVICPEQFRTFPCPSYPEIPLAILPGLGLAKRIEAIGPDAIHIATEGPLGLAGRLRQVFDPREAEIPPHVELRRLRVLPDGRQLGGDRRRDRADPGLQRRALGHERGGVARDVTVGGAGLDVGKRQRSGVGLHEHVDAIELLVGAFEEPVAVAPPADMALHRHGAAPRRGGDLIRGLDAVVVLAARDDDVGSDARERERHPPNRQEVADGRAAIHSQLDVDGGEPGPAALDKPVVGVLEARRRAHDAVLEPAALLVARAIERKQHVLAELGGFFADRLDDVGRGVLLAR